MCQSPTLSLFPSPYQSKVCKLILHLHCDRAPFTLPAAVGSVQVIFSYLPYFSVVCAAVTSISLVPPALESDFVDKSALLHCLFEGDTGRTSPNPVVSFHIRKHKGEVFSSAVRQHGFPYKWTQRVCGVSVMPESMDATAIQPHAEASAESIGEVVCALKQRFVSQVNVAHQLSALGNVHVFHL